MADESCTIWFNPNCSKCRGARDLVDERGVEATYVRYLDEAPARAELERVMGLLGIDDPRAMMRTGETVYRELDLAERIRQLRAQGEPRPAHHSTERASDASKDAIIKTLRLRIAELEQARRELADKNQQLQKQVEVLYGELNGRLQRDHPADRA